MPFASSRADLNFHFVLQTKLGRTMRLCFTSSMSRTPEGLCFAPGTTFADLDAAHDYRYPDLFRRRIAGYYLNPAKRLAAKYDAFAAGVLVVCAIDALALMMTSSTSVSGRITAFCRNIPCLSDGDNAEVFCKSFRHGLVHGARIKDDNEFSYEISKIAVRSHGHLAVHPGLLADEVSRILDLFVADLSRDPTEVKAFASKIRRKFHYELSHG
jgi:hypothetical protein